MMLSKIDKPPRIQIRNASLSYANEMLFDGLNLTLSAGKTTAILGPSGIGKTTLLRMLAGLNSLNSVFQGEISCEPELLIFENIAYIPQEDNLLPWLNALDNACLGYLLRGNLTEEIREKAHRLFADLGLQHSQTKFPHQLSGGMRQRVSLIRAILEDKCIVLMDEPFASIDAITRLELQSLASTWFKDHTVLLVTHDPLEALRMSDDIYILAGKPAHLTLFAKFNSSTPRAINHPHILNNQSTLFQALTKARDMT